MTALESTEAGNGHRLCVAIARCLALACAVMLFVPHGGPAVANPLCADFSSHGIDGTIGAPPAINGFVVKDVDAPPASRINTIDGGLQLSPGGVLVKLPVSSKEVKVRAASHCSMLEIRAMSNSATIGVHNLAVGIPLSEYTFAATESERITKIMTFGGCFEGILASICIIE